MSRCSSGVAIVLAGALISACETSSTVSASPDPVVKCTVSLGSTPMMDPGGGSGSLAVTTQPECAWDATTNVSWISGLSPASGQGTANISFRVAANEGASARDGMIVVNGEQARVSQRAPCRYDVAPSSQGAAVGGGPGNITISAASECAWTATSEVTWISLTSSAAGSGNGSVSFTVAANSGAARNGTIAVANQRATIAQAGVSTPPPACSVTISPTSQNIGAAGGAGTPVTVTAPSTCQWTSTTSAAWITITAGATGTGNGSVAFTVAANTGAARTGTLTIGGRAFTVSQAAASGPPPPPSCSYSISSSSDNVPAQGDNGNVNVSTTSACAWTASSNASWITITSGASGTGNGSVGYLVAPNVGASRTGTLTIAGQTFTVNQAALVCSYSVSPGNRRVGRSAGTSTFSVSTSSTCTWTATSNASWITITSGASGTGNGTVTFSYTQNTTDRDREGTLTVAGREVTVEQDR